MYLHRLRLLLAPETWLAVTRQARWRLGRTAPSPRILTWPVDEPLRRRTRILWPRRYAWSHAGPWVDPLRDGLGRLVPIETDDSLTQPSPRVVLFRLCADERDEVVAIDFGDKPDVDRSCLEQASLYFKMQYAASGYESDLVVPGGFVPGRNSIYSYLGNLRTIRDQAPVERSVYGRFGLRFASEVRRTAIGILSDDPRFEYKGGGRRVIYTQSLYESARAAVCVDLPGNGDFCHRLVDYFAIGACVIARPHRTSLHVPLKDGVHIVYTRDDLSDLADLCARYLEDDEGRRELCHNSRDFFDRYLHRDQLASYYLQTMFRRLHGVE
jgi:hypothetical protein